MKMILRYGGAIAAITVLVYLCAGRTEFGPDKPSVEYKAFSLGRVVIEYYEMTGEFPAALDDLHVVEWPVVHEDRLTDPWGTRFELEILGEGQFRLRSHGPDRISGTEDDLVFPARSVGSDQG